MRDVYVGELHARLPVGCRGLLVTLEYPPDEKAGPPFPVDAAEVERLYGRDWEVEQLERRDILIRAALRRRGRDRAAHRGLAVGEVVASGSLWERLQPRAFRHHRKLGKSSRLKPLLQWWGAGDGPRLNTTGKGTHGPL